MSRRSDIGFAFVVVVFLLGACGQQPSALHSPTIARVSLDAAAVSLADSLLNRSRYLLVAERRGCSTPFLTVASYLSHRRPDSLLVVVPALEGRLFRELSRNGSTNLVTDDQLLRRLIRFGNPVVFRRAKSSEVEAYALNPATVGEFKRVADVLLSADELPAEGRLARVD